MSVFGEIIFLFQPGLIVRQFHVRVGNVLFCEIKLSQCFSFPGLLMELGPLNIKSAAPLARNRAQKTNRNPSRRPENISPAWACDQPNNPRFP